MTRSDFSRYAAVSRRTALTGALGSALLALAACNNDDSALSGAGSGASAATPSAGSGPSSSDPASSSPSAKSAKPSTKASTKANAGQLLPAPATLTVAFSFAADDSGRGRIHSPYVAVWLENSAGHLVKTVALWHQHLHGEDRWLDEMKTYFALGADDATTVSSATRKPGNYTVQWDGSTLKGARAPVGTYRLFIEAAREHGPHELVQHDVTLGLEPAAYTLTPSGELTGASAKYVV